MYWLHLILALLPRSLEESEILQRIAQRDTVALARLYDLYGGLLYSFVLSIVRTEHEAEDVLQELFLHIWEKASSFDPSRGNAYTWLVTLARHRAIDRTRSKHFRAQQRTTSEPEAETQLVSPGPTPFDALVMHERAAVVRTALETLSAEQREVIQISYFGGYSQSEIAERLNLPLGTVKTRMRQAMIKLQRALKERI
jgi:RNA polymerase sigma-70 factor (ECF subfamily)